MLTVLKKAVTLYNLEWYTLSIDKRSVPQRFLTALKKSNYYMDFF